MDLALRLKLHKLENSGIFNAVLFHDTLNKNNSELIQGYCTVNGDTCWHVWSRVSGEDLDIARFIAILKDKEFERCEFKLGTEEPEGAQKDPETLELWELYKRDKGAFWRKAPKKFLDFRSSHLRRISKN